MYQAEKIIVIVGGGAAGLFAAVCLKERLPLARVCVVEAGGRALSKLRLTGGGRCNLTHTFEAVEALGEVYPRGERLLRKLFYRFGPQDTWRWFEERGLRLYAQSDGRVFPRSDRADEVADLLLRLASERGVELCEGTRVERIERSDAGWRACLAGGRRVEADAVLVATGGSPRREALERLLEDLPVELVAPVPSLFAFNVADGGLRALSGTTLADARLRLAGTKWQARGALLLTHFGLSGPAVLRLSSYAARHLAEAALRHAGIDQYFRGMLTCQEVGQGKDSPEIYERCMRRLRSTKRDTVVFEDALHAIQTAKAAGFRVCAVYDAFAEEDQAEIQKLADYYIRSFEEMFETKTLD